MRVHKQGSETRFIYSEGSYRGSYTGRWVCMVIGSYEGFIKREMGRYGNTWTSIWIVDCSPHEVLQKTGETLGEGSKAVSASASSFCFVQTKHKIEKNRQCSGWRRSVCWCHERMHIGSLRFD